MARPIRCNFKGEKNGNAKLGPSEVRALIYLYQTGSWTYQKLADRFSITKGHVHRIITRKAWSNLEV